MRKKLLTAVIVVSCRHSISRIAQSVLATPTTIHFVEISGWSTHDHTMNYSDAPAKLDELSELNKPGTLPGAGSLKSKFRPLSQSFHASKRDQNKLFIFFNFRQ